MTTHMLKRNRENFSTDFKVLLKHTSDALRLIDYQLSPFKDYRCNVEPWIEGQTSGRTLTINTRPIHDPLDSRKFEASASVWVNDGRGYMKGPTHPELEPLGYIDDLSAHVICEAFFNFHEMEFRRVFHALCDYHEGAKAIFIPF